jgi:hypothetical protein
LSDDEKDDRIELPWGRTPWDDLSREELLREVQRMYSAVVSMIGTLRVIRAGDENSPFWDTHGGGGHALAKGEQVRRAIESRFSGEHLFRGFYRYADDLLFEGLGSGWTVCDRCGRMLARGPEGSEFAGSRCIWCDMKGMASILRPLTWDDLRPRDGASTAGGAP